MKQRCACTQYKYYNIQNHKATIWCRNWSIYENSHEKYGKKMIKIIKFKISFLLLQRSQRFFYTQIGKLKRHILYKLQCLQFNSFVVKLNAWAIRTLGRFYSISISCRCAVLYTSWFFSISEFWYIFAKKFAIY